MLNPKVRTFMRIDKDSKLGKSQWCAPSLGTFVLRVMGLLTALGILVLAYRHADVLQNAAVAFINWISEMGWVGVGVFGVANVIAALLLLPSMLFTLAAGFLYGFWKGSALVLITSQIAAMTSFLIARYAIRSWVVASSGRVFASLDQSIKEEGMMLVLLIRCSPLHPYAFLNYAFGITSISITDYAIASFLGMLPASLMEVYFGSGLKDLAQLMSGNATAENKEEHSLFFWFGIILTLVSTIWISLWVKKKLASMSNQPGSIKSRELSPREKPSNSPSFGSEDEYEVDEVGLLWVESEMASTDKAADEGTKDHAAAPVSADKTATVNESSSPKIRPTTKRAVPTPLHTTSLVSNADAISAPHSSSIIILSNSLTGGRLNSGGVFAKNFENLDKSHKI